MDTTSPKKTGQLTKQIEVQRSGEPGQVDFDVAVRDIVLFVLGERAAAASMALFPCLLGRCRLIKKAGKFTSSGQQVFMMP